jgi:hypothetical protein
MKRNTVIYYDGGDNFKGEFELSPKERQDWHKKAHKEGQAGFLSGYRYFDNKSDGVIVYFTSKPSEDEIDKRRRNGLRNARWYWLAYCLNN